MYEVLHKDTTRTEVLPYLPTAKPGYALKRNELIMLLKKSGGVIVKQYCFWEIFVRRM